MSTRVRGGVSFGLVGTDVGIMKLEQTSTTRLAKNVAIRGKEGSECDLRRFQVLEGFQKAAGAPISPC